MNIFRQLTNLFYPDLCLCCGENLYGQEEYICTKCLCDIPKTNLHLQQDNLIEQRFWGKVPVEKATAFFFFGKGSRYQHLLHLLGQCLQARYQTAIFCFLYGIQLLCSI